MEALIISVSNQSSKIVSRILLLCIFLVSAGIPSYASPDDWVSLDKKANLTAWNFFEEKTSLELQSMLAPPPLALSCIPNMNISLNQQGFALITGIMLVNAPDYGPNSYSVDIMGPLTNIVTCNQLGQELMAVVTEIPTGNSCMSTLFIEDKLPPVLTCTPDTLPCNTDIPSIDFENYLESVTDNCDPNPNIWYSFVAQNLPCSPSRLTQRILVTWTATDASGNSATCVDTIYLRKPLLIDIDFPPDVSISCVDVNTDPSNTGEPTYNGEPIDHQCQFVAFKADVIIPMCHPTYKIRRTWTVMDWCTGAQVTDVQEILIVDTNKPSITCPANITLGTDFQVCTLKYTLPMPVVSDLCADANQIVVKITVPGYPIPLSPGNMVNLNLGTTLITMKATDPCGNTRICQYSVTVVDDLPPVIACPPDVTVDCTGSTDPGVTGNPIVNDICDNNPDVDYEDMTVATDGCAFGYVIMRTWTAEDESGNVATCMQIITLTDDIPPVITCPTDVTISCEESTDPSNTGNASASDICDSSPDLNYSDVTLEGTCPHQYIINRTWIAEDDCGNSSTCLQLIFVDDDVPPIIVCPADLTIECTSAFPTDLATATDNCSTDLTITYSDIICVNPIVGFNGPYDISLWSIIIPAEGGSVSVMSDHEVMLTSPDITTNCDNASVQFSINITSTGQIVFDWHYATLDGDGPSYDPFGYSLNGTFFQLTNDDGNDIQSGTTTVAVTAGDVFALDQRATDCIEGPGATSVVEFFACVEHMDEECTLLIIRTHTATDECDNMASCVQTIFFVDTIPPTITCPINVTIECVESTLPANTGSATASDNCDMGPFITYADVTVSSGNCDQEYSISRTWTAADGCGNTSTCVQVITVDDSTPPDIVCPASVTIECVESTNPSNTGFASATDNCDDDPDVDYSDVTIAGGCPQEYTITRTWTATDVCGNESTCNQTITVDDSTAPIITCPADVTIECDEATDPGNTGLANAIDNCDNNPNVEFTDATVAGACAQEYIITRTWTATDACGNSTACIQTIVVEDTTPPTITFCAANVTIECDESTLPANTGSSVASDNCDPAPSVVFEDVTLAGSCPQAYTITRTWTATDACGNGTNCIQVISVQDSTEPMITCPGNITIECDESTEPLNTGFATAVDNCDPAPAVIVLSSIIADGACPQAYVITRTWQATDACGNSSTCVQTITVEDSTPPTITFCPANTTIECDESTDPANTGFATATDNCTTAPIVSFSDASVAGACPQEYTITRTWTATDACGNSSSCVQIITIDDSTPPVITCPADVTLACTDSTDPADTGSATASDNCDGNPIVTFLDEVSPDGCSGEGGIVRTWTATDACGNSNTCVQIISIFDDLAPVITCPANTTIECTESTLPENTGFASATDNCDANPDITFSDVTIEGDCPILLTITRTWTASDACGNFNSCIQTITVTDEEIPLITCPADITIECDESTEPANTGFATATDECSPPEVTFSDITESVGCAEDIEIYRTWTATDGCGHTANCLQVIRLKDTTVPDITCPANVTVQCDENTLPPGTGLATATDNCDDAPIIGFSDVTAGGGCPDGYIITRTWIATDRCGNSSTCLQIVTIDDNVAPVIVCPDDITVECTDSTSPDNTGQASATDICDDAPDVTFIDVTVAGLCPQVYTITRTWTAMDNCGNASTCAQSISVDDNTAPTCLAMDITVELGPDNMITIVGSDVDNGSSDACGPVTFLVTPNTFTCENLGPNPVVLTVTDCSGNTSTCDATVTVIDNGELMASCQNITIYLDENGNASVNPEDIDNGSGGGCEPGDLTFELDQSAFDCTPLGGIQVTLTVTDEDGNEATCTAIVTVLDTFPPVITCPVNVTLGCDESTAPSNTGSATASDNCGGVIITSSDVLALDDCGLGTIMRTFVATDGSNNTSSCTQIITIENLNPFDEGDITWPAATVNVNICNSTHPSFTGRPVFNSQFPCANLDSFFVDVVQMFPDNDPATPCRIITRTWTVVDDCQPNGTFQFVQTINVTDAVPPLFTNINDMTKLANSNCVAPFTIIASATDCAGVSITNDSPYGVNSGANASGNYPYGVTVVIFTGTDGCGNISTMDVVITVNDPSPTQMMCEKKIIFLPFETDIILPADTFVTYSVGMCTDGDDFIISYSGTNPFDTLMLFDCGDVGVSTLSLWMWNLNGTMVVDSCETADLDLRDPLDYCQDGFTMNGTLENEEGQDIPDVEVSIMNAPMIPDTSNQAGQYTISGLNQGIGYGVTPFEDRNHRKGVSTLDLVLIQKHLLGKALLDSPYKLIAADANNSGSVTALDLLEIRKVILGINSKFPNNTSWRFVDADYSFEDPYNPFSPPFPEYIWVDSVTHDIDAADFIGLKVGDVNGSFFRTRASGNLIEPRSASAYALSIEHKEDQVTGEKLWTVSALPNQGEIAGLQFSIFAGGLSDRAIQEISSNLLSSDQLYYDPNTSTINVSWSTDIGQDISGRTILSIPEFGASLDIQVEEIPVMEPEAYVVEDNRIEVREVSLTMESSTSYTSSDYHLYQNIPNPFSERTRIKYALPANEVVTLVIHDVTGRQVYYKQVEGNAGMNQILIKKDDIGITGIYYYTLYTLNASFTHKMSFTND